MLNVNEESCLFNENTHSTNSRGVFKSIKDKEKTRLNVSLLVSVAI